MVLVTASYLSNANEKSQSHHLSPILSHALQEREDAPENTQSRKEYARPHPGEDHIGRNLADKIRDEEHENDDGVLARVQVEVFLHSSRLGIAA